MSETPETGTTNIGSNEGAVSNPASTPPVDGIASGRSARPRRKRIPMSVPHQRLEIQEIPGYRLYWHKEQNIDQALRAGYEFVGRDEASLNRIEIGGSYQQSSNTDLGTHVSLTQGVDSQGNPQRLVLMKLPLDDFKDDQMEIAKRNAAQIEAIFDDEHILGVGGQINERGELVYTPSEGASFHMNGRFKPVLNRPKRVAKIGRTR